MIMLKKCIGNNARLSKIRNEKEREKLRFREYLTQNEMSCGTVEEYTRNLNMYYKWIEQNGAREIPKGEDDLRKSVLDYKRGLQEAKLAASTTNAKLAALNKYLKFRGVHFKVKYLKVQKKMFRDSERELNKDEYEKLIKTARVLKKERIAMIIETLGSTGIRVSELKYITLEALEKQAIEISMKSKIRVIVVPEKIKHKLREYARSNNIEGGEIFITANGKSLSRNQIWREMKNVSNAAHVNETKVYPHNMRALFARTYYEECKDVVRLGDILGHSSIDTTRIYLKISIDECRQQMSKINIVA